MVAQEIPEPVASFIESTSSHHESAFLDAFTPAGLLNGGKTSRMTIREG